MARSEKSTPSHGAPLSAQNARQGQNITGMATVLIASLLLVMIAYLVMLAIANRPSEVVNAGKGSPPAATSASPPAQEIPPSAP